MAWTVSGVGMGKWVESELTSFACLQDTQQGKAETIRARGSAEYGVEVDAAEGGVCDDGG